MNEDLQPLIEILEVVKPYLGDIVLVGGVGPYCIWTMHPYLSDEDGADRGCRFCLSRSS